MREHISTIINSVKHIERTRTFILQPFNDHLDYWSIYYRVMATTLHEIIEEFPEHVNPPPFDEDDFERPGGVLLQYRARQVLARFCTGL